MTPIQIAFIVLASVILAAGLILAILLPLRKRYKRKKYKEYYYKKVYSIAYDSDYYLINNFKFRIENSKVGMIDHILFADKYIYLIHDYYYPGDVVGKISDANLISVDKENHRVYIDNPFKTLSKLLDRLSMVTSIDKDMLIGIVLVNDNCRTQVKTDNSKQYYIIQRSKLKPLIAQIESRNVGKIDPEALDKMVKSFSKLNRRKNKAA